MNSPPTARLQRAVFQASLVAVLLALFAIVAPTSDALQTDPQHESPILGSNPGLDGVVGFERYGALAAFTVTNAVTGDRDSYSWDYSALPPGTYGRDRGLWTGVYGVPTEAGVFRPRATVTTAAGTDTRSEHVTIYETLADLPGIQWFAHLPQRELQITAGEDIGYVSLAQGLFDDQGYQLRGLPSGIEYTTEHNLILTGTATEPGLYQVTVFESDLVGGPEAYYSTFTLEVLSTDLPDVTSSPGLDGIVGFQRYGALANFHADTNDEVRWYYSGLPTGAYTVENGANAYVYGAPTQAGVFAVTASAETFGGTGVGNEEITVHATAAELPGIQWFEHVPFGELTNIAGHEIYGITLDQAMSHNSGLQLRGLPPGIGQAQPGGAQLIGTPTQPGIYEVTVFESDLTGGPEAFSSTFTWEIEPFDVVLSDLDRDGTPDGSDACPTLAGFDQTEADCRPAFLPGDTIWDLQVSGEAEWDYDPQGKDTATTGQWQQGLSEESRYRGTLLQPAAPHELFATGLLRGASVGANDVDNGVTSLQSVEIELPDEPGLELTVDWYFAHLWNATDADTFEMWVQEVGSYNAVTVAEEAGNFASRNADWQEAIIDISSLAGRTVRLQGRAADRATPSLVEAGFAFPRITYSQSVPRFHPSDDELFSSPGQTVDTYLDAMDGKQTDEIRWSFDGLPPGIEFVDEGERVILRGSPTTPGIYEVTATVTQTWGNTPGSAVKRFVWTVDDRLTTR